ncbi:pyrimidine 5'-nucleotidase [Sphingobium sufflavum]|uniref:pyrimidine 5'-nucleotidase n=1 Tax=Sphingobium sufflavum TaxID=1129547 RepID=UPI001F247F19|nr:pyrimidine 5'-nucleotidase [Sphingobium sufflavum]MCE7794947.1 pyrimidine 5'-nucleotidase [Sphingobium sufflavum]
MDKSSTSRAPFPTLSTLAHVESWIFDLDNTLYPPEADLFALMDVRMTGYIAHLLNLPLEEARVLQKGWFRDHGNTLSGLMHHHDIDPCDFLAHVHDIALDRLSPDPVLRDMIERLPGRRLIYTNGDADYAGRVLERLELTGLFECVHDIHACAYVPKPQPPGYATLCAAYAVDPTRATFFEDMARNLAPAKALGMTTVWLNNGSEWGADIGTEGSHRDFIDYETPALAPFLTALFKE